MSIFYVYYVLTYARYLFENLFILLNKLISVFQPQNIVLMGTFPNCDIKLVDLEVARVIKEDEKICEIIGTPDYVGKK